MTINVTIGSGTGSVRTQMAAPEGTTVQELFELVRARSNGGITGDSHNVQVCGRKVPGDKRSSTTVRPGQSVWFLPAKTPWNLTRIHEAFGSSQTKTPADAPMNVVYQDEVPAAASSRRGHGRGHRLPRKQRRREAVGAFA